MVSLGFGKFARSDHIYALEPLLGDERGDGHRTKVWVEGIKDPIIAARTGMRGSHPGSFDVAHAIRDGRTFDVRHLPVEERVDLVVVGAGISGLAAAWFYRSRRPDDTILLLDNHDDFGGHAKRNEFHLDGRMLLGYGGSEAMQSPHGLYSEVAAGLVRSLGVDIERSSRPSTETCIRRSASRVASSSHARPSAPTGSSSATRCAWSPTTSRQTA